MNPSDKIIGIDLGTTNSVLAVIREGAPVLLPVNGDRLLPSVVGIAPDGDVLVGAAARNQWVVGARSHGPLDQAQDGQGRDGGHGRQDVHAPGDFGLHPDGDPGGGPGALGEGVRRAVITVPAYFNETQRQATLEAGEIAGLIVERIINEPTASALAYGYGLADDQHLKVLVYDLGGGTFDVSIIELHSGVVDVLATAGDNYLGGDDFDERLAARLVSEFDEEHHIDLREHHQAWARLRARRPRRPRSSSHRRPMPRSSWSTSPRTAKGIRCTSNARWTRAEFEELIADLLGRTMELVRKALVDAKLTRG